MAGSVNKVILVGNLGRDPEVRTFQNGGKVCNLRIATSENWKDRNTGERREKTEWHSVAIFSEPLARIAEQYLRKGSKVYIEGQLETRKWQDQSGQDRDTTEVVPPAAVIMAVAAVAAVRLLRRPATLTMKSRSEAYLSASASLSTSLTTSLGTSEVTKASPMPRAMMKRSRPSMTFLS